MRSIRSSVSSGPDAGVGQVGLRQVRPDQVDLRHRPWPAPAPPPRPAGTRDGCPRTAPAPCARDRTGARGARRRSRSVSGVVASYWKRPVSVTSPAYRQAAVSSGIVAAHHLDQPEHHLARGGRGRIDQRDRPETVVRTVVVDPDHLAGVRRRRSERTEPVERRAVARDHDGGRVGVVGDLDQVVGARQERGPAGQLQRLVRERAHRRGPACPEERREPEHGAERVGVGIEVARQRDLGGRAEHLRGARQLIHRHPPSSPSTLAGVQRRDQPVDLGRLLQRGVLLELQLREELHPDLLADHAAQPRDRRTEPRARGRALLVVAERRVVHPRAAQVGGHLHAGHGHEPDPRILQLGDLLRQDLAELFTDALDPRSLGHVPSVPAPERSHVMHPDDAA